MGAAKRRRQAQSEQQPSSPVITMITARPEQRPPRSLSAALCCTVLVFLVRHPHRDPRFEDGPQLDRPVVATVNAAWPAASRKGSAVPVWPMCGLGSIPANSAARLLGGYRGGRFCLSRYDDAERSL